MKLVKCVGPQTVSESLTRTLPRSVFEMYKEFMVGKRVTLPVLYDNVTKEVDPIVIMLHRLSYLFLCILRNVLNRYSQHLVNQNNLKKSGHGTILHGDNNNTVYTHNSIRPPCIIHR